MRHEDERRKQRRRRGSFGIGVAAAEAAAGEQTAVRRAVLTLAVRVRAAAHFERAVARELRLEALDERRKASCGLQVAAAARLRYRALGRLTLECGSLRLRLPHEHTQRTCAQRHTEGDCQFSGLCFVCACAEQTTCTAAPSSVRFRPAGVPLRVRTYSGVRTHSY